MPALFGMRALALRSPAFRAVRRVALLTACAVVAAGCSSTAGLGTSTNPPAQIIVTVTPLGGSSSTTVGFPSSLPRGLSTLTVTARDALGAPVAITTARYRLDVTPLAQGNYTASALNNLAYSVTISDAGTVSLTWKLVDLQSSSVVIGPVMVVVTLL
ncbi:MAG: hypothetical protein HYX65_01805 [Gemmatimonadetes bacterium]|nr:hypothetical protein [Gemmatimonadota bacterium]